MPGSREKANLGKKGSWPPSRRGGAQKEEGRRFETIYSDREASFSEKSRGEETGTEKKKVALQREKETLGRGGPGLGGQEER